MTDEKGQCEWRSTGNPQETKIAGRTFTATTVRFSDLDGIAIFEGDIALGRIEKMNADALRPMGVVVSYKDSLWRGRIVPYQLAPTLPSSDRIHAAIKHWQDNTSLQFVQRTVENANQYSDYLYFEDRGGCWSFVGRQGGRQTLSIGSGCSVGNAIHEIGHAVGLWHEQSRQDREGHVRIVMENVIPGREHNFDQHITDGDDVGDYDHGSVMHYPRDAFSRNGQDTIVPRQVGTEIGQRRGLSAGDIEAVRKLYP